MKYSKELLARVYGVYLPERLYKEGNSIVLYESPIKVADKMLNGWRLPITPLSDITDEDAIEVAKMLCQHGSVDFKEHSIDIVERNNEKVVVKIGGLYQHIYYDMRFISTSSIYVPTTYFPIYNTGQILDYLRSPVRKDGSIKPVYDCGYGDISLLIDAGIAVDKNTLKG